MRLQQANSCRILTLGKVSAEHAVGQKLVYRVIANPSLPGRSQAGR